MLPELLYSLDLWILFIGMAIAFPISAYLGFWCSIRKRRRLRLEKVEHSETVSAAILGLLALLLGFTFSMSLNRFEDRRNLVVDEANAIETAYLRAQLIAPNDRLELQNILKAYVDSRIDFFKADVARTQELQSQLWASVQRITAKDRSPVAALLVSVVNDILDLYSKRAAAMANHVPEIVYYLILVAMLIALISIGYSEGLSARRGYFWLAALSFLFAMVFLVIADLDRPRRGTIRVSQTPLLELQKKWR